MMIETIDLTKRYPNVIAVDRLNLTIMSGELFTLLGLNGAGKTTTIKMLSCLTPAWVVTAWWIIPRRSND